MPSRLAKTPAGSDDRCGFREHVVLDLFGLPFPIKLHQIGNVPPVSFWRRNSQFLFKSFLKSADIPVFAEHQRNYQPVVARAYLAIGAVISEKCAILPARNVRSIPCCRNGFGMEVGTLVPQIRNSDRLALADRRWWLPQPGRHT